MPERYSEQYKIDIVTSILIAAITTALDDIRAQQFLTAQQLQTLSDYFSGIQVTEQISLEELSKKGVASRPDSISDWINKLSKQALANLLPNNDNLEELVTNLITWRKFCIHARAQREKYEEQIQEEVTIVENYIRAQLATGSRLEYDEEVSNSLGIPVLRLKDRLRRIQDRSLVIERARILQKQASTILTPEVLKEVRTLMDREYQDYKQGTGRLSSLQAIINTLELPVNESSLYYAIDRNPDIFPREYITERFAITRKLDVQQMRNMQAAKGMNPVEQNFYLAMLEQGVSLSPYASDIEINEPLPLNYGDSTVNKFPDFILFREVGTPIYIEFNGHYHHSDRFVSKFAPDRPRYYSDAGEMVRLYEDNGYLVVVVDSRVLDDQQQLTKLSQDLIGLSQSTEEELLETVRNINQYFEGLYDEES